MTHITYNLIEMSLVLLESVLGSASPRGRGTPIRYTFSQTCVQNKEAFIEKISAPESWNELSKKQQKMLSKQQKNVIFFHYYKTDIFKLVMVAFTAISFHNYLKHKRLNL